MSNGWIEVNGNRYAARLNTKSIGVTFPDQTKDDDATVTVRYRHQGANPLSQTVGAMAFLSQRNPDIPWSLVGVKTSLDVAEVIISVTAKQAAAKRDAAAAKEAARLQSMIDGMRKSMTQTQKHDRSELEREIAEATLAWMEPHEGWAGIRVHAEAGQHLRELGYQYGELLKRIAAGTFSAEELASECRQFAMCDPRDNKTTVSKRVLDALRVAFGAEACTDLTERPGT